MKYTDIIFDLYGTLVDIHTDENALVWEKTSFFFGFYGAHYSPLELREQFAFLLRNRESVAGQNYECYPDIPVEQIMSDLFLAKGIDDPNGSLGLQAAQLFRICSMEYIRLYPGVLEALEKLRSSGCRLWLLSNAQRAFTAYELRYLGLDDELDGIYISSDYGCRKPDNRFYKALICEQNLDTNKCLMIGNDRDTDIAGAILAGMDTLYMHTELTPQEQAKANPSLLPDVAPSGTRHFEWEGDDWERLSTAVINLLNS